MQPKSIEHPAQFRFLDLDDDRGDVVGAAGVVGRGNQGVARALRMED